MTLSLPPAGALRTSIRVGGYGKQGIAAGPVGAAAALRHEQGTTRRAGPRRGGPGVPVHVGASDDTAWSRRCPNARTCRPPRAHAPDFLPSKPPPRRSDSLMSRGRGPAGLRDRQACTHYWLLAGPDRSHESRNRRTDPADDRNSHASHFEFERERERL